MALYGGVDVRAQRQSIRDDPPHVIVACPGRLHQLVMDKTVDLSGIKTFVIDEVDKVLEKPGTAPSLCLPMCWCNALA